MAQKFKFKLEALLKVREFKEKNLKVELGRIIQEIELQKERIVQINSDIDQSYQTHDQMVNEVVSGSFLQFFPAYLKGKKAELELAHNNLDSLQKKMEAKLIELAQARGETKVLENQKDREKTVHKKEIDKKIHEDIEELFIMRRSFQVEEQDE